MKILLLTTLLILLTSCKNDGFARVQEFLYPTYEGTYKTADKAVKKTVQLTNDEYVYSYILLKNKDISENEKEKIAKSIKSYTELPDEFERHAQLPSYVRTVESNLSKAKSKLDTETFSTSLLTKNQNNGRHFEIGEYDFTRKGFPILTTSTSSTAFINTMFSAEKLLNEYGVVPGHKSLSSRNDAIPVTIEYDLGAKKVNFLAMSVDKAKVFKENYSKKSSRVIIYGKPTGASTARISYGTGEYDRHITPNIIMEAFKIEFYTVENTGMVKFAELVKG